MATDSTEGEKNQNPPQGSAKENKKKTYWKAVRIAAVFGIIEVISLVLWSKSEDFGIEAARCVRSLADCGFLAGGAFLAHKLTGGKYKKLIKKGIWGLWVVACFLVFIFPIHKDWRTSPLLTVSLAVPDFPEYRLPLTNSYLKNGDPHATNFLPKGFVFIPLKAGQTNFAFAFDVWHDPGSETQVAEDIELGFKTSDFFPLQPSSGWEIVASGPEIGPRKSWVYSFPKPILIGDSFQTTPITGLYSGNVNSTSVAIVLRAKDCPAQQIFFLLTPVVMPSNGAPHKPFVIESDATAPDGTPGIKTESIFRMLAK